MSSSQPVVTPTALNFTPDNLRCYSYSGTISVSGSIGTMLEFETNSEYIVAKFEYHGALSQIGQNQIRCRLQFNDITIIDTYVDASLDHTIWDTPPTVIIPPFTKCNFSLAQASGSDKDMQLTLTGDVYGMTETGYQ